MADENGATPNYEEIGSWGVTTWGGFIQAAYNQTLNWPGVYTLYNRLRRSDAEIGGIVRPAFVNLARSTSVRVETAEDPTDDDLAAAEFLEQVLHDIKGGPAAMIEQWVSYVPFMGWGWWEVLLGQRSDGWAPPDNDPWRSSFDDGLVGVRRMAFRDHSSFMSWDMDEASGRLLGMNQQDWPNMAVTIPLERSLHLTFGDTHNPEGLTPLEAVWRLEANQRAYELVHGIGSEHAAGHLKFAREEGKLDSGDDTRIANAARAVMSAQQGNYMALPGGVDADIIDVTFAAASDIFEMIKYIGMLKLQAYQMQFVAIAVTSGLGSQTAIEDSRAQALLAFNGMVAGFWNQFNDQVVERLFSLSVNRAAYPNMTTVPKVVPTPIERKRSPAEVAQLFTALVVGGMPLGERDLIEIRRWVDLPDMLPDGDDAVAIEPATDDTVEAAQGVPSDAELTKQVDAMLDWADKNLEGFSEMYGGVQNGQAQATTEGSE